MTALIPSAIILVNNDLTDNVKAFIVRQLHINDVFDSGNDYDGYITANPDYLTNIKKFELRVLVQRPLYELNNRDTFDVVIFVKRGEATILANKIGPPNQIFPVVNLTWGNLNIYD